MSAVSATMSSRSSPRSARVLPNGAATNGPSTATTSPMPSVRPCSATAGLQVLGEPVPLVGFDPDEVRAGALLDGRDAGARRGPEDDALRAPVGGACPFQ